MELLALSASGEATVIVSAAGGVALLALIAFGVWWFRPFGSGSEDVSILEERDEEHWMGEDR